VRIALSGASGLIGGSVYKRLVVAKEVVRIGRRGNCAIQADFSRPESVTTVDLRGCDAVVYCAGVVDEDFKVDPAAAYVQSTLGLSTLVQRTLACGVRCFVYFSTAHVYGSLTGHISEETAVNPLSDYAIAHYAAEQIIRRHASNTDLKALVLRPNAVFGTPAYMGTFDRWSLIPFSFPLAAVYKQRIVLRSSGEQRRNFISTDDLAFYVEKFLESEDQFGSFTIVNPVGPETLSIHEFAVKCAEIYADLTGQKCIVTRPEPPGTDAGSDFVYESLNTYRQSVGSLDNYLIPFMEKVIADWKEGRKHGL